jgi:hypothetical protein
LILCNPTALISQLDEEDRELEKLQRELQEATTEVRSQSCNPLDEEDREVVKLIQERTTKRTTNKLSSEV